MALKRKNQKSLARGRSLSWDFLLVASTIPPHQERGGAKISCVGLISESKGGNLPWCTCDRACHYQHSEQARVTRVALVAKKVLETSTRPTRNQATRTRARASPPSDEQWGTPEVDRPLRLDRGRTGIVYWDAQHEQASNLAWGCRPASRRSKEKKKTHAQFRESFHQGGYRERHCQQSHALDLNSSWLSAFMVGHREDSAILAKERWESKPYREDQALGARARSAQRHNPHTPGPTEIPSRCCLHGCISIRDCPLMRTGMLNTSAGAGVGSYRPRRAEIFRR